MIDKFRRDNGAVSPVIGVILMVAVTVILAAVIATFVLGIGEEVSSPAPSATFDVETSNLTFEDGGGTEHSATVATIKQMNGEKIDTENLQVTIDGKQAWDISGLDGKDGQTVKPLAGIESVSSGTQFRAVLWENEYDLYPIETGDLVIYDSGGCNYVFKNSSTSDCKLSEDEIEGGETLRVIWTSPDGSSSSILKETTIRTESS